MEELEVNDTIEGLYDDNILIERSNKVSMIVINQVALIFLIIIVLAITSFIRKHYLKLRAKKEHQDRETVSPKTPHYVHNLPFETLPSGIRLYMRKSKTRGLKKPGRSSALKHLGSILRCELSPRTHIIQVPKSKYECGDGHSQFRRKGTDNKKYFYTYQMLGDNVQATWQHRKNKRVLAGYTVFIRSPNVSKSRYPMDLIEEFEGYPIKSVRETRKIDEKYAFLV